MTKPFKLSRMIWKRVEENSFKENFKSMIETEDVKEFIRLLKKEFKDGKMHSKSFINEKINNLAGKELK